MIARWHRHAALGTLKAFIPFQDELRQVKRRLRPYRTDEAMDRKLFADGVQMLTELLAAGARIEHSVVLEIGSGWHPLIPLLFHLAGASRVRMTDRVHLMDPSLVRHAAAYIERNAELLAAGAPDVPRGFAAAVNAMRSLDEMLDGLGIDYVVPFDIADLRDGSVDVLVSRAVLEHVRPDVLEPLLRECRRVLKPNGFMCHIIDNTDHYAHADRSINYVNFLRFEEWQWRLLTVNPFHYTNRLRHSDYRALLANAGFAIAQERTFVDNRSLQALDSMRVAPRYRDRDPADLAIATSLFVAVPRSSASRGAA